MRSVLYNIEGMITPPDPLPPPKKEGWDPTGRTAVLAYWPDSLVRHSVNSGHAHQVLVTWPDNKTLGERKPCELKQEERKPCEFKHEERKPCELKHEERKQWINSEMLRKETQRTETL